MPPWRSLLPPSLASAGRASPPPLCALRPLPSLLRSPPPACGSGGPSRSASLTSSDIIPDKVVQHAYTTGGKRYLPGFSFPAPRKLEQIIKYALLEREPPARIRAVWNEYHDARLDCVASTWSPAEFAAVNERRRRCPRFVYPVLRGGGAYFTLVAEWQDKFCIFTSLEDYRRNPGSAEPYLSVALFDEFLERKQVVLVRGDFSGHLTKADAAHLVNLMRYYYFTDPRAVETFNREPARFDFAAHLRDYPAPEAVRPKDATVDRPHG